VFDSTIQFKKPTRTIESLPDAISSTKVANSLEQAIPVGLLSMLFETTLEHLFPSQGLLLFNRKGNLIQSSPKARSLCRVLQRMAGPSKQDLTAWDLPLRIQALCHFMIDSRNAFPNHSIQLHDEINIRDHCRITLNGEWIDWGGAEPLYLIITLENQAESSEKRALFDAHRYQLTERETEVWTLALQGYSYNSIGEELFISLNTVKRHMKSIYDKRRSTLN
jgi:DNA-binding CsgD family transcriptional regulator